MAEQLRLYERDKRDENEQTVKNCIIVLAAAFRVQTILVAGPETEPQPMSWAIEHPGIDRHAEALKWRALRMMDENGKIPPDGLWRALDERRQVPVDTDLF